MAEFGHFAQCLAWLIAVVCVLGGFYGAARGKLAWYQTTRAGTFLVFVASFCALGALAFAFVQDDYTNQYVWQHSNKEMAAAYKITAIWGGMDGSMLLWAALLSLAGALVAWRAPTYPQMLMRWVLPVVNSTSLFFLSVVVFLTNPFRYLKSEFIPPDGNGLNPLLQNPFMAIHPPMLYVGFTFLAVPCAFCIAALLAGRLTNEWIRLTRRWTLIGWAFLTTGIILGGHWAYIELGWGGFWAWDPVENASFLPWLTATAFLHSVMVQERKDMLKFWNIWLVVLTYGLTVFGTFLTRSGVVQSVHAFASTNVGWVFLLYLACLFVGTLALVLWRRKELASERKIESFLSREAAFLVNNLVLLSICFATLWGVMFPVLSEALTGAKQTVGIPFFNAVNVPLFLLLLFVMGVGPLIAWKRSTWASLQKMFLVPFSAAFLTGVVLVWAQVGSFWPILSYSLCVFVLMTILGEVHRGVRVQMAAQGQQSGVAGSVARLMRRHRVRYGGHLVHLGVVVVAFGITSSMAFKTEKEFSLGKGESSSIGRFTLTLEELGEAAEKNYDALRASVSLKENDKLLKTLHPELRLYRRNKETTTEVALRMGMREDVYVVLAGVDDSGKRGTFKLFINPFQVWLWFGAMIMLLGTVIVILPEMGLRSILLGEAEQSRA
ncbi:MAG: heme lyase CcmF/NrfE family subunit [Oligoflexia bacterium]|nr:heme lyase CcmF/NrfE family subunit [Oligoflexia bacterium]